MLNPLWIHPQETGKPVKTMCIQRQQVSGQPMANFDEPTDVPVPGAAPKARGPPLPISEAKQPAVMINVPLPLRQRMNPHMPPPRIHVPMPKMSYPRIVGVPFSNGPCCQWKLPGRNAGYSSEIIDSNRAFSGKTCLATPECKLTGPWLLICFLKWLN